MPIVLLDVLLDLVAQPTIDDDQLIDRERRELVEQVSQEWLTSHIDQRLGFRPRVWPHARPETSQRNHEFHATTSSPIAGR